MDVMSWPEHPLDELARCEVASAVTVRARTGTRQHSTRLRTASSELAHHTWTSAVTRECDRAAIELHRCREFLVYIGSGCYILNGVAEGFVNGDVVSGETTGTLTHDHLSYLS